MIIAKNNLVFRLTYPPDRVLVLTLVSIENSIQLYKSFKVFEKSIKVCANMIVAIAIIAQFGYTRKTTYCDCESHIAAPKTKNGSESY